MAVKVVHAGLACRPRVPSALPAGNQVARKVSGRLPRRWSTPMWMARCRGWLPPMWPGRHWLTWWPKRGPMPRRSVLELAAGLAEGLSAIHAAGVVHRDLKPSNIMLAEDGPRLIDFGISSAAGVTR